MAEEVLKDCYVSINAVDLSDHVDQVKLTYKAESLNKESMGNNTRIKLAGMLDWSLEVTFKQDFAAGKTDATLFPLVGAAAFAVKVRPKKAVVIGATNPEFQGNCILTEYPIIDGSIGDLLKSGTSFEPASDLIRAVA